MVFDFEYVIEIGTAGKVVYKSELGGFDVADDFSCGYVVVEIFDFAIFRLVIEDFYVIGFGEQKDAAVVAGDGIEIDVVRADASVTARRRRLRGGGCYGRGRGNT